MINYSLIGIILILCIYLVKTIVGHRNNIRAIRYIFSQKNWMIILDEYDPARYYYKNLIHPLKWTYKQMFKGLGG